MAQFLSITIIIAASLWAGILITLVMGKFIISLVPMLRNNNSFDKKAVIADAIILKMEKTGLYINKQPQIRLHMQVQPDKGRSFIAEINQVPALINPENIKTGSVVKVKFNPHNFKELVLMPC